MQITLYKNASPNNNLTKTITDQLTLSGTLREETSIVDPEVTIQLTNPSIYNYCYIPGFKRFYYINDAVHIRNNLWKIKCHVDVLMTYKEEIKNHQAVIEKQTGTTQANLYIDDGDFVVQNKRTINTVTFPNGLNESPSFILITAGA